MGGGIATFSPLKHGPSGRTPRGAPWSPLCGEAVCPIVCVVVECRSGEADGGYVISDVFGGV